MSDYTISLVPRVSRYAFAEIAVDDILNWLVSKDIVKAELSECTLGNLGYAFSDGAQYIVLEPHFLPYQLDINGLEITTERTIFNTGQNGIDRIVCPNCTENIVDNEWIWIPVTRVLPITCCVRYAALKVTSINTFSNHSGDSAILDLHFGTGLN